MAHPVFTNSIHNRQDKSVVTHINIDNRSELRFYNGHSLSK